MPTKKIPKPTDDPINAVRNQIRSLLEETDHEMRPVKIDPSAGIDFYLQY